MSVRSFAEATGVLLARVYFGYSVFLLLGTIVGLHLIAFGLSLHWFGLPSRFRLRRLQWAVDLAYGFVNPLIYLVVLLANGPLWQRYPAVRTPLTFLAWTLFVVLWSFRLLIPPHLARHEGVCRAFRVLLAIAVVVIAGHGFLDLAVFVVPPLRSGGFRPGAGDWIRSLLAFSVIPGSLIGLYAVPIVRALTWMRILKSDADDLSVPGVFLLPRSAGLTLRVAIASLVVATLVSSAPRWSDRHAAAVVSTHHDEIVAVGRRYGVEPRTLAAIMWVTQRDQLSPLRDALERLTMAAWQWDSTGDYLLGTPLDISVGVMQVKPVTLQSAALIRDQALYGATGTNADTVQAGRWSAASYQLRREAFVSANWTWPGEGIRDLSPPFKVPATKPSVTAALLDDRWNIEASALILALYQWQWESADPSWSIRTRPDILATLYQIGFERSRPHESPVSNRFGTRVLEIYNSPWVRAAFPSTDQGRRTDQGRTKDGLRTD
jgi:hypothetical protein